MSHSFKPHIKIFSSETNRFFLSLEQHKMLQGCLELYNGASSSAVNLSEGFKWEMRQEGRVPAASSSPQ